MSLISLLFTYHFYFLPVPYLSVVSYRRLVYDDQASLRVRGEGNISPPPPPPSPHTHPCWFIFVVWDTEPCCDLPFWLSSVSVYLLPVCFLPVRFLLYTLHTSHLWLSSTSVCLLPVCFLPVRFLLYTLHTSHLCDLQQVAGHDGQASPGVRDKRLLPPCIPPPPPYSPVTVRPPCPPPSPSPSPSSWYGSPSPCVMLVRVNGTAAATGQTFLPAYRLVGLVVKASSSRAEGPGFESRLRRDFFRGRVIPVT